VFGGRFSSSIGPVGIDFGTHGVKMLQLRDQGGQLHVVGASRIEVPLIAVSAEGAAPAASQPKSETASPVPQADIELLGDQIRAAFSAGGFTGRKCIVSVARQDVCVQSIRLPKMPDEELRQSAVWEASQRFGFDRTAMEVDFIRTEATLASGENREEVILIAASHDSIHARLEPLLWAGLRPLAVDTGFAALARTFSQQARREGDRSLVRAVVEIGTSGTTVLILRGDQIAFCKPITISGVNFNQAVAEHLRIDLKAASELRAARIAEVASSRSTSGPEADVATDRAVYEAVRPLMGELIKEVTLCLRYYGVTFRGHPPERIILTGGDGLEPRLAETMAKTCNLPVSFDEPTPLLSSLIGEIQATLNRTPGPAASWAVATGLALRGLGSRRQRTQAIPAEAGLRGAA